jgi:hypothetical protein
MEIMNATTLNLEGFTGTERYYKHLLGILYTDGVKYLAQEAGAIFQLSVNSEQLSVKNGQLITDN